MPLDHAQQAAQHASFLHKSARLSAAARILTPSVSSEAVALAAAKTFSQTAVRPFLLPLSTNSRLQRMALWTTRRLARTEAAAAAPSPAPAFAGSMRSAAPSASGADAYRMQSDSALRSHIAALAQAGRFDRIAAIVGSASSQRQSAPQQQPAASNNSYSQQNDNGFAADENMNGSQPASPNVIGTIVDSRDHIVRTNVAEWERALGVSLPVRQQQQQRTQSTSSRSSSGYSYSASRRNAQSDGSGSNASPADLSPIHVIISEAWSWSKFSRKLGTNLFITILALAGVAVLLDQQGIIKSATGMTSTQVEPTANTQTVRFSDVQGVDEAKQELEEVVEFLKEPAKFVELGGKLPKGILLYGPPGTGKTHLARAVAGEAGVPFFQMSGSEFDELYVGVGARRVRELFAAAKKRAPCIIFIDELDAVGSKRSMKDQSYMRQTLNQLLVELDGFSSTEGVILIAATNTPDSLDKALVRPGRFDRLVPVPLPDVKGRSQILRVHMRGVQMDPRVDPEIIARGTPGFSGADLANLVNQAAIRASKSNARRVTNADLEWAKDKIIMGSEKKSAVITEENKKLTAYHEGGHTLVALYTPGAMPLHKVTVIPRGNALGVTVQLPEGDKTNHTKKELQAMLDVCMGGRVAEELIFGADEITTGASSDLQKATAIAREMVMAYGMSDKVGLLNFNDDAFEKASSQTKAMIEDEVKSILKASYERASNLLTKHKDELHRLAKSLVEYETLTQEEVKTAIKDGDLSHKK